MTEHFKHETRAHGAKLEPATTVASITTNMLTEAMSTPRRVSIGADGKVTQPPIFGGAKTIGDIVNHIPGTVFVSKPIITHTSTPFADHGLGNATLAKPTPETIHDIIEWKLACMVVDAEKSYAELLQFDAVNKKQGYALSKLGAIILDLKTTMKILKEEKPKA